MKIPRLILGHTNEVFFRIKIIQNNKPDEAAKILDLGVKRVVATMKQDKGKGQTDKCWFGVGNPTFLTSFYTIRRFIAVCITDGLWILFQTNCEDQS